MLYLLWETLQIQCVDYNFIDYPKNLSEIQSAIAIQLTNQGINNYFSKNIIFSGDWLVKAQIADLNLKISQFKIKFSDIKISNYNLPECQVNYKTDSADFSIKNLSIYLSAQFEILQNTYPYFQDKGTAQLQIIGINIIGQGRLFFDDTCPLHYFIDIQQPITNVDKISVTLNGKLASIYNSILTTLTDTLVSQFNENLGPTIVNALLEVGNNALGVNTNFVINPLYTTEIGLDQRPISYTLNRDFLTLHTVGQTLVTDDDTITNYSSIIRGYNNFSYSEMPSYVTNDNVQYKLHYLAFQSSLEKLIIRNKINNETDQIKVDSITVKNYVNTGMHANIRIIDGNDSYDVESIMKIKANPQFYVSKMVNQTLIYVRNIIPLSATKNNKQIQINEPLLKIFDTQFSNIVDATKLYGIQITNSNGINECQTLVINEDWLHVGCMIQ